MVTNACLVTPILAAPAARLEPKGDSHAPPAFFLPALACLLALPVPGYRPHTSAYQLRRQFSCFCYGYHRDCGKYRVGSAALLPQLINDRFSLEYAVTLSTDSSRCVVYEAATSTNQSRFEGNHLVISSLLKPKTSSQHAAPKALSRQTMLQISSTRSYYV